MRLSLLLAAGFHRLSLREGERVSPKDQVEDAAGLNQCEDAGEDTRQLGHERRKIALDRGERL